MSRVIDTQCLWYVFYWMYRYPNEQSVRGRSDYCFSLLLACSALEESVRQATKTGKRDRLAFSLDGLRLTSCNSHIVCRTGIDLVERNSPRR